MRRPTVNRFVLTYDNSIPASPFADATAAAHALNELHPGWQLVKKVANVFELNTVETLETVRNVLPPHFSVRETVYADIQPPRLDLDAVRRAVARQSASKQ